MANLQRLNNMELLNTIQRPILVLDRNKCVANIQHMVQKAQKHRLRFRPHFKTHQSQTIGLWFKEQGVRQITVSSLSMADYFAQSGWEDITVAFPVNLREMERINQLASQITLNLLVEDVEVLKQLALKLRADVGLFIKIDTGYHRTGIPANDFKQVDILCSEMAKHSQLRFKGFLTHAGNTYSAQSVEEILHIHQQNLLQLSRLKQSFKKRFAELLISIGDTPSCSLADDFTSVDEIRPGNFVFYDVMQWQLGSCRLDQIAVALACPVVAKHPERHELVLYGGAIHFSKDFITLDDGTKCFGLMVEWEEHGWKIPEQLWPVVSLSQEHGIVKVDQSVMKRIAVGDVVGILPIHSCLTAHAMKGYLTTDGQWLDHFNAIDLPLNEM